MADRHSQSGSIREEDIHLRLSPTPQHKGRRNFDVNVTPRDLRKDLNERRSQARSAHSHRSTRSVSQDDPANVRAHDELLRKQRQITK